MKKLLAATVIITTFFASSSFAADVPASSTAGVSSTPATQAQAVKEAIKAPEGVLTNKLIADAPLPSDYVLGQKDAPVVMIEYASLSCPHCAMFYTTIMPDIQKNYIDTGKIRFVLRQFPLNEPAFRGAMLVNCVAEQGGAEKYYLFNKVLFDSQSKWAFDGNWQEGLEKIAAIGGVSKEQFLECISNNELEAKALVVKKQAMDDLKVPHTPYLYIGGEAYNGEKDFLSISKFIDSKLPKK